MQSQVQDFWRKCSVCKKPIKLNSQYYVCSVSTCNGQRTGYVFCSIGCFETHLPGARHREAGAIEKLSPRTPEVFSEGASATPTSSPQRIIVKSPAVAASSSGVAASTGFGGKAALPREVLIVASRLKEYVQAKSEYNTSASVMDVLSDHVRVITDRAIDNARAEGRRTVLERDFDFLSAAWKKL
jgi:hypothetical protein